MSSSLWNVNFAVTKTFRVLLLALISATLLFAQPSSTTHSTGSMVGTSRNKVNASEEPLDVEGYPLAPPELKLEQVHVYVRHGERTPVKVRLSDPPASIPEHWQLCHAARNFRELIAGPKCHDDEPIRVKKAVETREGLTADGLCLLGELTDTGKESTFGYGAALRKLYVERLGFLPDVLQRNEQAYFRSTNVPRTVESLQHLVYGLYPASKCLPEVVPAILVRNGVDENLVSNTISCPRLAILELEFAEAAAALWNPTLESLNGKVSKYLSGQPLQIDGKPRASGVLDTIRSATAHGFRVPPEFEEDDVINTIETAVSSEWFAVKDEESRRLGMGRLLADVSQKMQHKVKKGPQDPMKILVHATHDSTLAALCSTFDVFDEKWPPFTSSVTFELFKKQQPSNSPSSLQTLLGKAWKSHQPEHYVRMRYKNRNMVLPMCAEEGKHLPGSPEFCTLSAFQLRIKELTPTDWTAECKPRA
ncbi:histidine phosphatase superfamily [Hygrophoropsis aurantiaca]|uniref:Histidine phosphatase superfamily n=1 Tax=Hygrophoropsis aurantiaca TaxID=72124 RepID=A0ACB8AB99_9AGAM|nr:histidine phosphatase superfamily [Hygrophoropsis aurantiaca]